MTVEELYECLSEVIDEGLGQVPICIFLEKGKNLTLYDLTVADPLNKNISYSTTVHVRSRM